MQLPLQQVPALGLHDWLAGSATPLAIAAHPSGVLVALARGTTLAVLPLLPLDDSSGHHHSSSMPVQHSKHELTALAWFVQLRPHRSVAQQRQPAVREQQHPAALAAGSPAQQRRSKQAARAADQQQQHRHQTPAAAAQALAECEVLLSGTADGHLQIHAASGQLLFRQRLGLGPVLDVLVRPHCSGLRCADAGEEVAVTFANAIVRISALDLRSQVRMLQLAAGGGPNAAATIAPLPHVRYEVPSSVGPRVSGLSFGPLPADLYALLSSAAAGSGSSLGLGGGRSNKLNKIAIVTVGRSPCLAVFEAEEQPSRSTLAALVGMASSLTSGVVGAASKAAGLGPSIMYHGVKSLMRPLAGWYAGSSAAGSDASDPDSSAVVSFEDVQQLPKPESMSLLRQLRDDRVLEGLVPAPVGALLVSPDNLGRVMLLEGSSMTAIRMWKGYRDAQCGWLLPPPHHPASPLGLLLVLFAPKRQVLEIWLPRAGQRLASRAVDFPCLLVEVGLPCGGWGNGAVLAAWQEQCSCATTLVVNVESGEVFDAMECLLEDDEDKS